MYNAKFGETTSFSQLSSCRSAQLARNGYLTFIRSINLRITSGWSSALVAFPVVPGFEINFCLQPNCHVFADPYVEHDTLTLLIDLILLKRGVYRHLLYNRGSPPRHADNSSTQQKTNGQQGEREWVCFPSIIPGAAVEILQSRWSFVFQLGSSLVFLDACECYGIY